jgi:hypothetical protein
MTEAVELSPTLQARPQRRRGRTPGSGYQRVDEPLLAEMHCLLRECRAPTPEAAARAVASHAYGGGTFEAKVDRLAKAYRRQFRSATLG